MRLLCPFKGDSGTRAPSATPSSKARAESSKHIEHTLGQLCFGFSGWFSMGGRENPTPPGYEGSSSVATFGSYRKFYKAQTCLVQGEIKIHCAHK